MRISPGYLQLSCVCMTNRINKLIQFFSLSVQEILRRLSTYVREPWTAATQASYWLVGCSSLVWPTSSAHL